MNRRHFLRGAAGGAVATWGAATSGWGQNPRWVGANGRVNLAVIGIRGMGQNHIKEFAQLPGVEVVAICDVDANLFPERVEKLFRQAGRKEPRIYTDLRRLLEDKDIDAVSVVTPNHWHTLAAIWAMQAGKHVTVEKPCCHTFWEGRKLVEAARKYKVVAMDGAEQRSNPCAQGMATYLQGGGLGEVFLAKGFCYKWRDTIGRAPEEPVPSGVDYDLWTGPAPKKPFTRNRFHYNWHWHWDYGNGDLGNQGVHEMDVARWGLGVKLPVKVSAVGGHLMFDDDQETPNQLMAVFEFPGPEGKGEKKKILQFEVRHWITDNGGMDLRTEDASNTYMTSAANTVGNTFYGSKGYLVKDVNQWRTYLGKDKEPGPGGGGLANHYQHFIDCIRRGEGAKNNAPIEEGFYTCALVHLANISYRVGRTLQFDPATLAIVGDAEANAMLTKEYRTPFAVPERV